MLYYEYNEVRRISFGEMLKIYQNLFFNLAIGVEKWKIKIHIK